MTQHSRILASDFSLPSDEGIVDVLSSNNDSLAKLGAHHMVVYSGLDDPRRVFATLGLHDRGSIDKLLRNPAVMDWFDAAGVEEIPPLFAGEVVEKIDLVDEPADHTGIIVAAIVRSTTWMSCWRRFGAACGGSSLQESGVSGSTGRSMTGTRS